MQEQIKIICKLLKKSFSSILIGEVLYDVIQLITAVNVCHINTCSSSIMLVLGFSVMFLTKKQTNKKKVCIQKTPSPCHVTTFITRFGFTLSRKGHMLLAHEKTMNLNIFPNVSHNTHDAVIARFSLRKYVSVMSPAPASTHEDYNSQDPMESKSSLDL